MSIDWKALTGWSEDQLSDLQLTAYAYLRQGKYEIAATIFEALVALEPNNNYNSQTLGALYLQLNKPEQALKFLEKSLREEGDHGPTLLNLAKAFFVLGKKEEGLKIAEILKKENSIAVSNMAKALILAYSS